MAYTTIDDPSLYFQAQLYTGTGSSQAITLSGATDMALDILWIHNRDAAEGIDMYDRLRGVTSRMRTSTTAVEDDQSANSVSAIGTDGFTVVSNTATNADTNKYVAYCWDESVTAGCDIVLYSGTGSTQTVSHSLSAVPHVMIVKRRNEVEDWQVYHHKNTAAPETDHLELNSTALTADDAARWNDTAPTSSVFTVEDHASTNEASDTYVAYLFTEKQGYSKFGSYVGNGVSSGVNQLGGPFTFVGFKPAFLMIKEAAGTAGQGWMIFDSSRSPTNRVDHELKGNNNAAETTESHWVDFYANGFNTRTNGTAINRSGSTYIYMAFAEAPFVNSNGVPGTAR